MNFKLGFLGGHTGSAPSPFDALNGPRLAGPQGSHPLHSVTAEELLRPSDGPVAGEIVLDHPAMVGEGITGRIRLTATQEVSARKAYCDWSAFAWTRFDGPWTTTTPRAESPPPSAGLRRAGSSS